MPVRRLAAAALGVGLGALVLSSTSGTGALWRDSASLDGGQVRSGELSLLNGDAVTQVADYAFDELAGSALRPGSSVQAPLIISNGGSAELTYRLSSTSATGSTELPAAFELAVVRVAASSACATGVGVAAPTGTSLYTGPFLGASTDPGRFLTTTASEVLCLRLTLSTSAPETTQLASSRMTFTFTAVSV